MEGSNWELTENQASGTIKTAIQHIRNRTKILICKADKGICTFIMYKEDYNLKINSMLSELPHKSIRNEPTNIHEKSVKSVTQQLLNSNTITRNIHN